MISSDIYDADDILRESMDFPEDDLLTDDEISVDELDFAGNRKADLGALTEDDDTAADLL